MASERFVDVTYRGLRVAQRAKLSEGDTDQGFVEVEAPLPVGTRVHVAGEGDFLVEARVAGVVEQEAGAKTAAGMRLDWRQPQAATTLEIDPDNDFLPEGSEAAEGSPPGNPPAAGDDAGSSGSPAAESRGRRRRKKNPPGRS